MKRMKDLKLSLVSKYSLMFILASILTFGYFVVNDKSFIWHLDGYAQHNVALTYYGTWLRDISKNILINHTFSVPMWDFGIGYGGDIITTLNYYVLGEPLNLLSVFVAPQYTEYLYAFLIILRLYLAGLFFIQFCKIMGKTGNAVIAGALVYVFTGYTMWAAVRHPFFILPIMFFPLMLTGVEKVLKDRKPYHFILAIVLCAISNFYFFYMITVLTVIYTFVRCIFLHKKNIKKTFVKLGSMLLYAIVAITISAVIFLPVIILFLGDNRNDVNNSIPILYDLQYYQKLFSTFISSDSSGYWNHMGYSPVVILGIFFMFKKRGIQQKVFFIIGILFMLFPIAGSFMNGFSYVSNRWIWAFAMFCAFIFVKYWSEIISINKNNIKHLMIVLGIYSGLICLMQNTRIENVLIELLILLFLVMVLSQLNQNQKVSVYKLEAVVILSVICSIAINSLYIYSISEKNYISEFIDRGKVYEIYKTSQSSDIKKYIKDESFFRFSSSGEEYDDINNSTAKEILSQGLAGDYKSDRQKLDFCDNAAMLFDVKGIGFYWSLGNKNVSDYLLRMDAREYSTFIYHGIDDRAGLLSLSSVKYYISEKGNDNVVPYGFRKYKTINKSVPYSVRSKKITKYNKRKSKTEYNIYVNDFALPLGYTYDKTVTEKELEKYTGIEKEQAMLQAAIVEKKEVMNRSSLSNFKGKELDYRIICGSGVEYKKNRFVVTDKNADVFIEFNSEKNNGLYAYIQNLKFTPGNPLYQFEDQLSSFSTAEQNYLKNQYRNWKEGTSVSILFNCNGVYKNLTQYSNNQSYYNGKKNYVVNLGYSKEGRYRLQLSFEHRGFYSFDKLSLVDFSYENYKKNINHLKENALTEVSQQSNSINGKITLQQKKLLCLTIPYNDGWKIYVDGKESNLLKVNYMYSGVYLNPGKHDIRLEYCTPGLKLGICISGIGILIFMGIIVFQYKIDKRK